jgi:diguanylate cyclase (GGDEF)-like protein
LRGQVRELEQRSHEDAVLAEMAGLLQTCHSTDQAGAVVTACAARLFPTDQGALFLQDGASQPLQVLAVWGEPPLSLGNPAPAEGSVPAAAEPPGSLSVPLLAQGEHLGLLHIRLSPRNDRRHAAEERVAHAIADLAALALANLRLRQDLREQAIRDPLTGLFNRRHMEESLERELRRAERRQRGLGIILLDLDHFKRCNDTFGHEAGDAVLRVIGQFLRTHIRGEDLACRYGGEEFLLILADSSLENTHRRAEQLRGEIKALQVEHAGRPLGPVSASLGVAVFPEQGVTAEEIVRAADAALYQAKTEGRDRVVVGEAMALAGPHFGRLGPAPARQSG